MFFGALMIFAGCVAAAGAKDLDQAVLTLIVFALVHAGFTNIGDSSVQEFISAMACWFPAGILIASFADAEY